MSQRPLSSLASRAQEDGSGTSWVPAGCPSRETGGKSLGWAHGEWSAEPKLAPPPLPGQPQAASIRRQWAGPQRGLLHRLGGVAPGCRVTCTGCSVVSWPCGCG